MSDFLRNERYAAAVGTLYGKYKTTFRSDNDQVSAELFVQGNELVAYVSFGTGFSIQNVTDAYLSPLRQKAKDLGYSGKFKIIYSAD